MDNGDLADKPPYTSEEALEDDDLIELELEEAGLVPPPDGGWGWVVVFASFLANVLVDGIIFTVGQGFQPLWEDYFDASSGAVAWPVSLLSGCYLLAGPIASALANYFGCRGVAMAGTLLAFVGFFLSIFVPKLWVLYITFGIMGGLGFGLIYLPAIVIVSYYFERRRALATGIAVAGSGIGTFVFAPLIQLLLQYFSWQQTLLLLSGVVLNCLVCGALYRSLKPTQRQVQKVLEVANKYSTSRQHITSLNGSVLPEQETMDDFVHSPHVTSGVAIERFDGAHRRSRTTSEQRPFMSLMELRAKERRTSLFNFSQPGENVRSRADMYRIISQESIAQLNRPLSRMDIFYAGSVQNIHQPRPSMATSHLTLPPIAELPIGTNWKDNMRITLQSMLDVSLLRSPSFLLLAISGFFTLSGFFVPFIYLPRQAELMGHSKDHATFLVSILGITNIVARIVCGWFSDQPWLNALTINNVALTIGGVATIFVPFMQPYWLLCIYCVIFGFGTACFASLRSIICVELLGIERLTNAFGFLLLFMGVAALLGSPIAGSFYDATGDYDLSFYVTGSVITLSGLLGFPLKFLNEWEKRRESAKVSMEEEDAEVVVTSHNLDQYPMHQIAPVQEEDEDKSTTHSSN